MCEVVYQRWSDEETRALTELREKIGQECWNSVPQFQEVVGDRKLIRFLRGHDHNVDKVRDLYIKMLAWRKENKVDDIRQKIVHGGINHPRLFPNGEKILNLVPQIVLAHEVLDESYCPLVIDQYKFSPTNVMNSITIEEYILFVIYSLEYRSLIIEQMSEERERKVLENLKEKNSESNEPYGVLVYTCVIRDLNGVGFDHFSARGREIISAVIKIASDNYPELMRKCYIINSPFIFNTIWYFIQGLLSPRSAAKIMVVGADFAKHIEKEIRVESLPPFLGGSQVIGETCFEFDSKDGGLLGMHKYTQVSILPDTGVASDQPPMTEHVDVTE